MGKGNHGLLGFTYREKGWDFIAAVASLSSIVIDENWEDRHRGAPDGAKSISVDGMDIRMPEEHPFHPGNYSHKFNGPGGRVEIGVSYDGRIVSVEGPFRAGFYPDDKIFLENTWPRMDPGETAEGDEIPIVKRQRQQNLEAVNLFEVFKRSWQLRCMCTYSKYRSSCELCKIYSRKKSFSDGIFL